MQRIMYRCFWATLQVQLSAFPELSCLSESTLFTEEFLSAIRQILMAGLLALSYYYYDFFFKLTIINKLLFVMKSMNFYF